MTARSLGGLLAALLASTAAAAVPGALGYQGRLVRADGTPETGVVEAVFVLYGSADGPDELWRENQRLALTQGYYATFLGQTTPLSPAVLEDGERWLELQVGGEPLLPRQRVGSVFFALKAGEAQNLRGGSVDASEVKVGGNTVLDGTGRLAGNARYHAGPGLQVDDARQRIELKACDAGQILKWTGSDWSCAEDGGATYLAADGGGLLLQDGAFALTRTCTSGQMLKWDGTRWGCADDVDTPGTVTSVTAAGPLLVATGTTTPALSIERSSATTDGYLAASDFADFSAKLGVASAAGGDLTGTLPNATVAKVQGRPVAATAPAPNQVLKWNGTAWAPAADANGGGTVTSVTGAGPLSVATGTTTPAITIAKSSATTDGYLAATDFAAFNAKLGATSAAGGDLTGTLPNATVAKVQGRPVAATAPAPNQVLKWNGSAWAPAADANGGGTVTSVTGAGPLSVATGTTTPAITIAKSSATTDGYLAATDFAAFNAKLGATSAAGGDLTGTLSNATVAKVQGRPVAATAPTANQVLKWTGAAWAPATDANSGGTVTSVSATGPLSVATGTTTPALSITRASTTVNGYLAATDFAAFNAKLGSGSAAGGDLSGTLPNPTVAKLQGRAVAATAPSADQVLAWNGSAWAPSTVADIVQVGIYKVNNGTPTNYVVSPKRYVVEATPAALGTVVPLDVTITDELCRDLDGCMVSIQMINWDGTQEVASRGERLYVSMNSNRWRFENNDVAAIDANAGINEWTPWDCSFTDAETATSTANGRADNLRGFGLLNVRGGTYSDATTICRIVLDD